jgi:hypothetical protein
MRIRTPDGSLRSPVETSRSPSANLKRRSFLLALGAGGAGAAATAVAALPGAGIVAQPAASVIAEGSSYRETEHVRDYYRTARI